MKTKFNLIITSVLFMFGVVAFAQQTLTGSVIDETGAPLPAATVVIDNTNEGTTTDFNGEFTLSAEIGQTVTISFVGYVSQTMTIDADFVLNVQLQPSNQLDEIILTGQGSGIERRKLSTTVDVLNSEEIDKLPATQIDQLLQSNAPSAQIRLSSGQPGTAAIIRTRGAISASTSSTPVIIVDGIRVDNLNSNPALGLYTGGADVSALADIPVESIEKIEYIKGGAASTLYGADAANGVIQIITKKGNQEKTRFFSKLKLALSKVLMITLNTIELLKLFLSLDYQTNIGLASLVEVIKQLIIFQVLYIMTTPLMI